MLWWGRERIFSPFRAPVQPIRHQTEKNAFGALSESREIEVNAAALESGGGPPGNRHAAAVSLATRIS